MALWNALLILIEHCAGKFPLWLTPEQARILALSDKHNDYAENVSKVLENYDIRALVDSRSEKVGRKIRDAELEKIPTCSLWEKTKNPKELSQCVSKRVTSVR